MCFSEKASWLALAASWSGCLALASTGKKEMEVLAGALAVVGTMQLWEALLWRESRRAGGRCTQRNALISRLGALNNHLEPIAYWLLAAAALRPRSGTLQQAAAICTVAYSALFGYITLQFSRKRREQQCTLRRPCGGLVWQWNEHGWAYVLFIACLLVTTYAYLPPGTDHAAALAIVLTYGASHALYSGTKMIGSMWCFFAAFLPWFAVSRA